MELQNQAVNIIELISQRLDPLFKRWIFISKFRESDPAIFAEHLRYKKGGFQFKITACLHPHDYPYSLSIQLIDRRYTPWKYINKRELFAMVQRLCEVRESNLPIATDLEVQTTVEELYKIVKCILNNSSKME